MMARIGAIGTVLLLAGIVAACGSSAPTATPTVAATEPEQATELSPQDQAFETEWQELIAAAQEEGKLVTAFTSGDGTGFRPLLKIFAEEFGIDVTNALGRGREVRDRVLAEQYAGQFLVDVVGMSIGSSNYLHEAGALQPFEPWLFHPDVKDPSLWKNGRFWWGDSEQAYSFMYAISNRTVAVHYNTNLVAPDEVPQSHFDLLDPKWKGVIVESSNPAIDPISGSEAAAYLATEEGLEFMRRYWNDVRPDVIGNTQLMNDMIARGTYSLTTGSFPSAEIVEMKGFGLPIDQSQLSDFGEWKGGSGGGVQMAKGTPHPNASKLFVNWMLGPDGWEARTRVIRDTPRAELSTSFVEGVPLLKGLSTDHLLPEQLIPEGDLYVPQADPTFVARLEEMKQSLIDIARSAGY